MKKIVFVLSLLALTGSVVTSCSKDREEVATQVITKENLVASGRFVAVSLTILDENGKVLKTETPGSGEDLDYYDGLVFKKDGTVISFEQEKPTDKIQEKSKKYELEGNKLILKGDNKDSEDLIYEIVEFVKGKYLKFKTNDVLYSSEKGQNVKVTRLLELEVK